MQSKSDGSAGSSKVMSAYANMGSVLVNTSKIDTCICALLEIC